MHDIRHSPTVESMKIDSQIERLLDESQNAHRCAVTTDVNLRRKLRRRCESGELTMPYPQLFARKETWDALNPREKKRHVILALAMVRPDWIFCAQSAACLYGIEQSYQIHDNPMIHIASTHESGIYRARRSDAVIHRVYTPNPQYNVINGAKVTTLPCTIYQCALVLPFEQILPLADSAVRSGMALDDLRQFPVHSATEALAIGNVLEYTDPRSENGGETLARSRFIERGLMIPQLQKEFPNPQNPEYPFRVDFIWILPNGRMIVAEYDGMTKYGNDRKTIANHVHREKLRDEALRQHGVTAIIHFDYEDLLNPNELIARLVAAGVPYRR
ncbi:Hypothetical protein BALAC2494_01150 [Bifidobacterium animalis subsp. lactis CNCM I-2494]|uniref:CTP synthase n=2 Tax=Bifidobacterium TaxID=1678 RepID=A0A806FSW2_BIFAN|nr:Hypothetical protein BALAC2494_01150 [Bifidobacterium animalis subsp. lactis CNCM I-2494]